MFPDASDKNTGLYGDESTFVKRRMLPISVTPAEITLMKSLPETFRHAYALAKIVKTKEVCSKIEIDNLPTRLYSRQKKSKNEHLSQSNHLD